MRMCMGKKILKVAHQTCPPGLACTCLVSSSEEKNGQRQAQGESSENNETVTNPFLALTQTF